MITAADVARCTSRDDVLALVASLGYPVAPVDVDREEWKRGGIELPWNGGVRLSLVSRLAHLDLFLVEGELADEQVSQFVRACESYNAVTKTALIRCGAGGVALFDIDDQKRLRRLDFNTTHLAHAVDRLNVLADPPAERRSVRKLFDHALGREALTREFFRRFRDAVNAVRDALSAQCDEEPKRVASQALLFMSRLLFLQFVQKKGWLAGERRFLVDRLTHERRGSYYAEVLAPLFFGCLNTPVRQRDAAARRLGPIPYLNGGLFNPSAFEVAHPELDLPDALMREILEDVFERFEFSTDEADAAGAHVDPEMLGKVFESLMAEDDRLVSGSFYTPRPIVEAITRRAIVEQIADDGERVQLMHALTTGASVELSAGRASAILDALRDVTVLDPACGSGAFLLASLVTIESLEHMLAPIAGEEVAADVRRRIVERSLFGVDINAEAVRLCELRLWLAMIADTDAPVDAIEPLPNLDRNILQGNSLLGSADHLGSARGDVYREWLAAVRAQRDLVRRYQTASRDERPNLYRLLRSNDQRIATQLLLRAIELDEAEFAAASAERKNLFGDTIAPDRVRLGELSRRLERSRTALRAIEDDGELDFFAFDVHFAHVLERGGFDVVIGNPPWVRNSRIEPELKRMCSERYRLFEAPRRHADKGFHQPDLSIAFVDRSLSLARRGGIVALLLPSKVATARYAERLRRHLETQTAIVELRDWSDEGRRWFEADTFPLQLVVRTAPASSRYVTLRAGAGEWFVPQSSLRAMGSAWTIADPRVTTVLRRLVEQHHPLSIALARRPVMGIKTGDNGAFFLGEVQLRSNGVRTSDGVTIPYAAVSRCVRGRDVRRWAINGSEWMLWPPANGWPSVPRWLQRHADARGVDPKSLQFAYVRPGHVGIHVVWKDVAKGMMAAVLPETVHVRGEAVPLVANQTLYLLEATSMDEAWAIAALLNSTVVDALLLCSAEQAKDGHYRYFGRTVAEVPVPDLSSREVRANLARCGRRAAADGRQQLDELVASLYGVSNAELEVLRAFVDSRLGTTR